MHHYKLIHTVLNWNFLFRHRKFPWQVHFILSISFIVLSTSVHCTEIQKNMIELGWPSWVRNISQLFTYTCVVFSLLLVSLKLCLASPTVAQINSGRLVYVPSLYTCTFKQLNSSNPDLPIPAVENLNHWFTDSYLILGIQLYCCTVIL